MTYIRQTLFFSGDAIVVVEVEDSDTYAKKPDYQQIISCRRFKNCRFL